MAQKLLLGLVMIRRSATAVLFVAALAVPAAAQPAQPAQPAPMTDRWEDVSHINGSS